MGDVGFQLIAFNGEKTILIASQCRGNTLADVYTDAHTTQILSLSEYLCMCTCVPQKHTIAGIQNTWKI